MMFKILFFYLVVAFCVSHINTLESIPNDERNLELLALTMNPNDIWPDSELTTEIKEDVSFLRNKYEFINDVSYYPRQFQGEAITVYPTVETLQAMKAGKYDKWDTYNKDFGARVDDFCSAEEQCVKIHFAKTTNTLKIAKLYSKLDGIISAVPDPQNGDGSSICMYTYEKKLNKRRANEEEVKPTEKQVHYLFSQAWDKCAEGCSYHRYFHFIVKKVGEKSTYNFKESFIADDPSIGYLHCKSTPGWMQDTCLMGEDIKRKCHVSTDLPHMSTIFSTSVFSSEDETPIATSTSELFSNNTLLVVLFIIGSFVVVFLLVALSAFLWARFGNKVMKVDGGKYQGFAQLMNDTGDEESHSTALEMDEIGELPDFFDDSK